MAEKIAKKLDLEEKTVIECKDFELKEGDFNSPLWILKIEDKLKIALDANDYIKLMNNFKNIMKENLELKLEKAILSEFPIDYDDVKAVVLEEMKNDQYSSIDEIVDKVKLEHPNLFLNVELDKLF